MSASYEEFAAQHLADHGNLFNRWCAVAGNYLLPVLSAVALLSRRPRAAAALFASGQAILVAGHVVEGNLLRNVGYVARHPIWAARADFAVATATIMRRPIHPG
jgi:hypothetical protein